MAENIKLAAASVGRKRHEQQCRACRHAQLRVMEARFISWERPETIAKDFGISEDTLRRHANASGLYAKRRRNLLVIPEKMIEKMDTARMNAGNVLVAVKLLQKLMKQEIEQEEPGDAQDDDEEENEE